VKGIAYLSLVADCDLDHKFKNDKGQSYNCLGLIYSERSVVHANDDANKWKAHKYYDNIRLMKIAFTDILRVGKDDDKCCWSNQKYLVIDAVLI